MIDKSNRPHDAQVLSALPVFEAVVRLGSFTKAAKEMGLTQGAVSRRIQSLEHNLGVVLFSRRGRTLTITGDGLRLGEAASDALNLMEKTRQALGGPVSGTIRVGVMNSIGGLWLAPRLLDFAKDYPDVSITVTTIDSDFSTAHKDPVTWDPSALDVVLTWGFGGWRSLVARPFYWEEMVPVCSPDFRQRYPLDDPSDMLHAPRLIHTTRAGSWSSYAVAMGFEMRTPNIDAPGNLSFEHFFMIREAACAGAGVGLIPKLLIEEDLGLGRLIACAAPAKTGARYAIVASEIALSRPVVAAFVTWVEAQVPPLAGDKRQG